MAANAAPELQVLIPYSRLIELLDAAKRVDELTKQVEGLSDQQGALRGQFCELMQAFGDLRNFVQD